MSRLKHDIILKSVELLDVALLALPFMLCWYLYYAQDIQVPLTRFMHIVIFIMYAVLYIALGKIYGAFEMSICRITELVYNQMFAAIVSDGVLYLVVCLLSARLCNLWPDVAVIVGQLALAILWATFVHKWYYATFSPQTVAVIYDERRGIEKLIDEYNLTRKYNVKCTITAQKCLEDLHQLDTIETVFLSGIHSQSRNRILKYCVARNINVFIIPCLGDVIMRGAHPVHMFHLPMLHIDRYMVTMEYLIAKRAIDILLSLMALVITSPILLATAIAIRITDGSPVFYKQMRLTKAGRMFEIVKFRSMKIEAEKDGVARLSTGDKDDRVTGIGKIIRKYRIDELPQLINILKGDMSICGPRPERPEIAAQYCEEIPEFNLRLQAKAGLTGYAQVYGKYNTSPYDKLQMDLMYIAHPSILEDFKIMLVTVKILFMPESTEGIQEGKTTALMK